MERVGQHFRKSDRILKRDVFRRVYEHGERVYGRYFTAFVLDNDSDTLRIGLTVTRKIGNAVERNRCRRLLREAFRKHRSVAAGVGADLVVNAKRQLVTATSAEVEDDLRRFLARLERSKSGL